MTNCRECGSECDDSWCAECKVKVFGPSDRLVKCPDCGERVRTFCLPCDTVHLSDRQFGGQTGWVRMGGEVILEWIERD